MNSWHLPSGLTPRASCRSVEELIELIADVEIRAVMSELHGRQRPLEDGLVSARRGVGNSGAPALPAASSTTCLRGQCAHLPPGAQRHNLDTPRPVDPELRSSSPIPTRRARSTPPPFIPELPIFGMSRTWPRTSTPSRYRLALPFSDSTPDISASCSVRGDGNWLSSPHP